MPNENTCLPSIDYLFIRISFFFSLLPFPTYIQTSPALLFRSSESSLCTCWSRCVSSFWASDFLFPQLSVLSKAGWSSFPPRFRGSVFVCWWCFCVLSFIASVCRFCLFGVHSAAFRSNARTAFRLLLLLPSAVCSDFRLPFLIRLSLPPSPSCMHSFFCVHTSAKATMRRCLHPLALICWLTNLIWSFSLIRPIRSFAFVYVRFPATQSRKSLFLIKFPICFFFRSHTVAMASFFSVFLPQMLDNRITFFITQMFSSSC